MKFCPYCGTEVALGGIRYCTECGKELPVKKEKAEKKESRKDEKLQQGHHGREKLPDRRTKMQEKKKEERTGRAEIPERKPYPDGDGYDGYYDDILPIDEGHDSEGLDRELVRKILLLLAAVLLIIGMCVALMYVV